MRPLKSTTVTDPASRCVARKAITFLSSLSRRRFRSTLAIRRMASRLGQLLRHYNFRASRPSLHHVELIHEGAHQKDSPARGAQQILLRERVRYISESKPGSLIQYVNDQLFRGDVYREMNL